VRPKPNAGGSPKFHIRECEELCSAARSEFKHMDYSQVLALTLAEPLITNILKPSFLGLSIVQMH
jgi:hypothetical protein